MCKKVTLIISLVLIFVPFGSCFAKAGPGLVSFELPASGAVEENGTDRPIDEEGVARIKVRLSSPQKGLVSVDYSVVAGSATGSGVDYVLEPGTLTFKPGETEKEITIIIIRDGRDEEDETIELALSDVKGGILGSISRHTYTIIDPRPLIYFSPSRSVQSESESPVQITVKLAAASDKTVLVDYRMLSSTASSGVDFEELPPGRLIFKPGQTSKTVEVLLIANEVPEGDELMVLELSNAVNARLKETKYVCTILDKPVETPAVKRGTNSKKLTGLIVTGQSNHNWRDGTDAIKQILDQSGLFKIDVAISPSEDEDVKTYKPNFAPYDVVVLNYVGDSWCRETEKNLEDYVSNGGGLVAFHAANNSFPEWHEYNRMMGLGGWEHRNEKWGPYLRWTGGKVLRDYSPGEAGAHPSKHIIKMISRSPEHPIMKGLPDEWLHARDGFNVEMRGPAENMEILATSYSDPDMDEGTGENEPMIWTVKYGKGKVFHTLLGNTGGRPSVGMECVGFIVTFIRGTEWAATGQVTYEIPDDFPTASEVKRWDAYNPPALIKAPAGVCTVQFEKTSSSSIEAKGELEIPLVLSQPQDKPVTVDFKRVRSTASDKKDFNLKYGTLTFAPGETRKVLRPITFDGTDTDHPKTMALRLSNPTNAVLGGKSLFTHTFIDNDGLDWDGKRWYYSDVPTNYVVNGQWQLEWEPVDDQQIVARLDDQRLSEPGDVAEFTYKWLSDGPTTGCDCMPLSECIDDDVTCRAGSGDFRMGLFDSSGGGFVTADGGGGENEVFRGYRGYKFYVSPHVSKDAGRILDINGETHIPGSICKRKHPSADSMLLNKNFNYTRMKITGGYELPLNTFSVLTLRLERLDNRSIQASITLNDITYTAIDNDPADQPQNIDVFAISYPNARNYTRWVLAPIGELIRESED
jgi:type 1 glutamine amidotransferase